MQVPKRRSQLLRIHEEEQAVYLTPQGIRRLHEQLHDLEQFQRPQAIQDVSIAHAKGDLSENAEYTEAKARLGRIEGRIFSLKERLKRIVEIPPGSRDGKIDLGSTVDVEVNGTQKTYQIVGPQETNPGLGRISHVSPLGQALRGHVEGDDVLLETDAGRMFYHVLHVR